MIINITKWKFILIVLIAFLLGAGLSYSVGFAKGMNTCVSWGVDKALEFIGESNISESLKIGLKNDLWRYKNDIGGTLCTLTSF